MAISADWALFGSQRKKHKFLAPSAPSLKAPIATPRRSDAAIQTSAAEQRAKFFQTEGGRSRTMLTGASGFTSGFSTGTAKLLGATSAA